jgi:hypothetical protein
VATRDFVDALSGRKLSRADAVMQLARLRAVAEQQRLTSAQDRAALQALARGLLKNKRGGADPNPEDLVRAAEQLRSLAQRLRDGKASASERADVSGATSAAASAGASASLREQLGRADPAKSGSEADAVKAMEALAQSLQAEGGPQPDPQASSDAALADRLQMLAEQLAAGPQAPGAGPPQPASQSGEGQASTAPNAETGSGQLPSGSGEPKGQKDQGSGAGRNPGESSGPGQPHELGSAALDVKLQGADSPEGDSSSKVIEQAARRGFRRGAYGRLYGDYRQVVEADLSAEAVPPIARARVRRYFELIEPTD